MRTLKSLFSYRAIESTARRCIMRVPRDDLSMYHNATSLGSIDIRYCSTEYGSICVVLLFYAWLDTHSPSPRY